MACCWALWAPAASIYTRHGPTLTQLTECTLQERSRHQHAGPARTQSALWATRSQASSAQDALSCRDAQLERAQAERAGLAAEVQQLRARLASSREQVSCSRAELAGWQARALQLQVQRSSALAQVREAQQAGRASRQQAAQALAELERLRAAGQREAAARQLALQTQLDVALKEAATLPSLKGQLRHAHAQLARAGQDAASPARQALEGSRQELVLARTELQQQRASGSAAQAELNAMRQALHAARREAAVLPSLRSRLRHALTPPARAAWSAVHLAGSPSSPAEHAKARSRLQPPCDGVQATAQGARRQPDGAGQRLGSLEQQPAASWAGLTGARHQLRRRGAELQAAPGQLAQDTAESGQAQRSQAQRLQAENARLQAQLGQVQAGGMAGDVQHAAADDRQPARVSTPASPARPGPAFAPGLESSAGQAEACASQTRSQAPHAWPVQEALRAGAHLRLISVQRCRPPAPCLHGTAQVRPALQLPPLAC